MKETKVYVDKLPKSCSECPCAHEDVAECKWCQAFSHGLLTYIPDTTYTKERLEDCPLKSLHDYKKELVAKVLGMVRENLKEELLLTKNENQEEAKLKLVKTYSIDLDVLNKIEKEILNGYTKI